MCSHTFKFCLLFYVAAAEAATSSRPPSPMLPSRQLYSKDITEQLLMLFEILNEAPGGNSWASCSGISGHLYIESPGLLFELRFL